MAARTEDATQIRGEGPPVGHQRLVVLMWGGGEMESFSPSSAQPRFPEAIGEGTQKESCPFREGWKIKWCKSMDGLAFEAVKLALPLDILRFL